MHLLHVGPIRIMSASALHGPVGSTRTARAGLEVICTFATVYLLSLALPKVPSTQWYAN